ncbi:bacteriocin-associated integral membrane family protein [Paraclostridium ghonii]|uniref:Bacteriocin-associated integral membrane protein n=1 Tax=Paraclostridium ghonii TaxID=29358 RepID=A0ABU0N424_9FIRM|nr:DUF1430 domain-containing protein [Paeniclostridium ghonii]MDQ0557451.1 bacteriocin-associated integral membrane protein [Paeniclostridium ghonii]
MKKKSVLVIIVLTVLMNIFSFIHINKNLIDNLLFDKTRVTFRFDEKSVLDEKFLNKIIDFSKSKNVEISQYSFLSSNKIDIYSTMKDDYKEILLIPNLLLNKDIKVHDFDEIYNVGFKNLFYFDTKDKNIIREFSKEFTSYGKLYDDLGTEYEGSGVSFNKLIKYMDADFLSTVPLLIFVFTLIILFNYLNNKKKYLVHELWGYSKIQIYCILNKTLYKTLFITILSCNLIMIGIIYICNLTSVLSEFIPMTIVLNLFMVLLLLLFSIILFSLSFINLNNKNEKRRLSKIRFIANLSKFCLLLLIILSFKNLSYQMSTLKDNEESLNLWKDTKNLYNIEGMYYVDEEHLDIDDEINEKVLKVYKELCKLDKVFIINSLNFEYTPLINSENKNIDYNYKRNVKDEKDLYSPDGRNIMVDKNYLKRNLVKTFDGKKNVLDKIDNNSDVLNVLVPQKLKKYETDIKKSYREWFYFQKVHIYNMYKDARNQELSKKKIDDLKINLIYIENNQTYFTYDTYSGDYLNNIKDPLVTVYTENVDNSVLAATLGVYMFLESTNEYSALEEVKNITQKYNATELNAITSVYDKKGQQISDIEDKIDRLTLNIIVISLVLIMLIIVITYVYYKSYISKIVIKSLYGYTFIDTYKDLLLSNIYIYILVFLLMTIVYKEIDIFIVILITSMLVIDFITTKMVNNTLIRKSEIKLIKGELK